MFNYDWFNGPAFQEQQDEAKWRCAVNHFPDVPPEDRAENEGIQKLFAELETRALIYLRDGFSYEVKEIADVGSKAHLVFECMPVDDHYKVGAFVVATYERSSAWKCSPCTPARSGGFRRSRLRGHPINGSKYAEPDRPSTASTIQLFTIEKSGATVRSRGAGAHHRPALGLRQSAAESTAPMGRPFRARWSIG
jgi:hypothetical protein